MKTALLRLARGLGLFALAERLTHGKLRILAYHGIWEGEGHYGNFLFMKPETFSSRMRFLTDWNANVLPLAEALERLQNRTLPPRAVVITIDDGWQGACRVMGECLQREGFPATLYVCSYYSEKQRPVFDVMLAYLYHLATQRGCDVLLPGDVLGANEAVAEPVTESELRRYAGTLDEDTERQALLRQVAEAIGVDYGELEQSRLLHLASRKELLAMTRQGVDLQLHTHRHRTRIQGKSCLEEEIADNRKWLQGLAKSPLEHFCYPSGEFCEDDWPALRKMGIRSATTTDIGMVSANTNPLALPRILDGQDLSELELEAELSGFMTIVRSALKCRGSHRSVTA